MDQLFQLISLDQLIQIIWVMAEICVILFSIEMILAFLTGFMLVINGANMKKSECNNTKTNYL